MYRYYITKKNNQGALHLPEQPVPATTYSYGQNGSDFQYIGKVFGYAEYEEPLDGSVVEDFYLKAGTIPTYHTINEDMARRAKEMMSYFEYVHGSATDSYRRQVDEAYVIADRCKKRVDPMYHEKIDHLAARYSEKLAANLNDNYRIGTMCPSILISGGSNFPVAKKKKQNAAMDRNMEEYREIQKILDRIKSVGTGGISSDDPMALEKLRKKLEVLIKHQDLMKAANAAIRMKDTAKGDAKLAELGYTPEEIKQLREPDFCGRIGYPAYALSNNNANIRRIKERIAELEKRESEEAPNGWKFDGGEVQMNKDENRLQIFFEGKPDEGTRTDLKSHGFRWSPRNGCWQRQLTNNAVWAAKRLVPPTE